MSPADFSSLWQQKVFPKNRLLITFDDGFEDNLQYALPLLKKYNFSAIFFVSGDKLGKPATHCTHQLDKRKMIMGVHELKELVKNGFTIANHFYSHQPLISMTREEIEIDHKKNIELLTHYLGKGFIPSLAAYPKNKTNHEVQGYLSNLGIKLAFAGKNRVATSKHHSLDIPRIQVFDTDINSKFLAKLSPYYRL